MTVKELIEELKKYPDDMIIAVGHDAWRSRQDHLPHSEIEIKKAEWIDSNYPYNEEDFEYLNLEAH